jgi:hypothetical protein
MRRGALAKPGALKLQHTQASSQCRDDLFELRNLFARQFCHGGLAVTTLEWPLYR